MTALGDRVAVVTGGSGALGSAVTRRLLADGAAVAVPWTTAEAWERLQASVDRGARDRLLGEPADVTDRPSLGRFVDAVLRRWRRVDALVATVGGFAGGALVDTDRDTWDAMLRVNVTSAFETARAVVPHLSSGGRIVTVASRAVLPPAGGFIAYTAAKAALVALTLALAEELRPRRVTVNAVAPGTMDTPANRRAMPAADPAAWVPVTTVADAIAFLVSDAAAGITGTVVRM